MASFCRECGAQVFLRGIRSLGDIESEFTMIMANRKLDPSIETVLLMADEGYSHISSSLIKQIASMAGDEELARFVPVEVVAAIRKRFTANRHQLSTVPKRNSLPFPELSGGTRPALPLAVGVQFFPAPSPSSLFRWRRR